MTTSPREQPAADRADLIDPTLQFLLLEDVLPRAHRALVLGPHDPAAISLISERVREVTWVDASDSLAPSDSADARTPAPQNCTVMSAVPSDAGDWDVVVALQDPRTTHVAPGSSPWATLDRALELLAPGGTAVVVIPNPNPLVDLTDDNAGAGTRGEQHVVSAPLLGARLASFRRGPVATYGLFGQLGATVALRDDVGQATGAGHWPTDLAARASGASPQIAGRLASSGLTWTLASGWIGIVGGQGAPVYTRSPDQGWARAHSSPETGEWNLTSAGAAAAEVKVGPGVSAENALRQAMLDGDYSTFRAVARALGDLSRSPAQTGPIDFRDVYVGGGEAIQPAASDSSYATDSATAESHHEPVDSELELVQSWRDFDNRSGTARSPWDEMLSADARLAQRLILSGADARSLVGQAPAAESPDEGVVADLREAVARRDAQLRHREEYIRGLRRQWTDLQLELDERERELASVTSSAAYLRGQRAEVVRSPKRLAGAIVSRGKGAVRRVAGVVRNRS